MLIGREQLAMQQTLLQMQYLRLLLHNDPGFLSFGIGAQRRPKPETG
jgi:hypothetical protein